MAKQRPEFEHFRIETPTIKGVPTWEECGKIQTAYRQRRPIKSGGESASLGELSKAIERLRASAPLVMERLSIGFLARRIEALEAEVKSLKQAASLPESIIVPVETFEPYPFDVVKPFQVVVEPIDGEFEANLYDANIGASGDTETEAIENLKDIMVNLFERYSKDGEAKLGPGPAKQWAILKSLLNKRV